jgi:hypothetical protein
VAQPCKLAQSESVPEAEMILLVDFTVTQFQAKRGAPPASR